MQPTLSDKPTRILLVEDDIDIQQAMADILLEEGFDVQLASNGQLALDLLNAGNFYPDVILLDLMMPVMNGYAFRQAQQAAAHISRIPVVVVSADRNASEQAKKMQAAAFLPKPVNLTDLLATLERVAAKTPAARVASR